MQNFLSQIHYSLIGNPKNSRKVVFLHGLMAFAANWRKIATLFEADFECLIYDQRGHGRSFKPESGYAIEDFANDLHKITSELGWSKFHLVGHSMGARVAMVCAHKRPESVITLTLEDMGPDSNESALGYYKNMLDFIPTPFLSKELMKQFFENNFVNEFKSKEPIAVLSTFLQANIEEKSDGKYDWKFSKNAILEIVQKTNSRDHWLEVSSFKMPVLCVRGENSHVISKLTFEKMQTVNPNISGIEITGASHWVHYEKSAEFAQYLKKFILLHDA